MKEAVTLFEFNEFVRQALALNFPDQLWIQAEIGQCNEGGGHFFFDLVQKDETSDNIIARSGGVMWNARFLDFTLQFPQWEKVFQEGNEVRVLAKLDYHERYGMRLTIDEFDTEFTLGQIAKKRAEVVRKLKEEGLWAKNKKQPLSDVLQRIAVISSAGAAGLQDFIQQLSDNPFGYKFHYTLFESGVQGDKAAEMMSKRLREIGRLHRNFDCIVIIRGGGARMDLSAFDYYALGKAICKCPLPVITGVGHDIDESIADQVANLALKTPTAVAEFLIQRNANFESNLIGLAELIERRSVQFIHMEQSKLETTTNALMIHAQSRLYKEDKLLSNIEQNTLHTVDKHIRDMGRELNLLDSFFKSRRLDPILRQGFAIVRKDGRVVDADTPIKNGDRINIELADRDFVAIIQALNTKK